MFVIGSPTFDKVPWISRTCFLNTSLHFRRFLSCVCLYSRLRHSVVRLAEQKNSRFWHLAACYKKVLVYWLGSCVELNHHLLSKSFAYYPLITHAAGFSDDLEIVYAWIGILIDGSVYGYDRNVFSVSP